MSSEPLYVCAVVLRYLDDLGDEAQLMHTGSKESCENLADCLPAVSYSGNRPVKDARVAVLPQSEWQEMAVPK